MVSLEEVTSREVVQVQATDRVVITCRGHRVMSARPRQWFSREDTAHDPGPVCPARGARRTEGRRSRRPNPRRGLGPRGRARDWAKTGKRVTPWSCLLTTEVPAGRRPRARLTRTEHYERPAHDDAPAPAPAPAPAAAGRDAPGPGAARVRR